MTGGMVYGQGPPASSGTEFVASLPFLYLTEGRADLLLTITATADATVRVDLRATGESTTRFVPAGSAWHYRVARAQIGYPLQQEGRSNRSVRIRSSAPVTVQAAHDADYITDSWLLPPVSDLGRNHVVASIWSGSTSGGVVTVTAVEPNTTLRITPSVSTPRGGAPGFSYGITLDSGEVWQIVPTVPEFTDLTGTRIEADRPVLVLGGHAGSMLEGRGALNPLIEWMPPLEYWGTDFVSRPYPFRRAGIYKVVASEDGTVLWVNGAPIDTIDAGESRRWNDPFPVWFRTSHPALIAQFVDHTQDSTAGSHDGDPSMTILQPDRVWSTAYRWTTLALPDRIGIAPGSADRIPFGHYLMVAADFSDGLHPVVLDGRDISGFLTARLAGTGYAVGWIPVDTGGHRLTAPRPVSLQAFGFNSYDAYAHPLGFPPPPLADLSGAVDSTCEAEYVTNLYLRNRSDEPVVVDSVLAGGPRIAGSPAGLEIAPRRELRLLYRRPLSGIGRHRDTVRLQIRGTQSGRTGQVSSHVDVERVAPVLHLTPPLLAFPATTPAEPESVAELRLSNRGSLPIDLSSLDLPAEVRLLSPTLPVRILPDSSLTLRLAVRPQFFPAELAGMIGIATGTCPGDTLIPYTARADVDREPTFLVDTLRILCDEFETDQEFRIVNGTPHVVDVDSVALPATLIPVDLPRGVPLRQGESSVGRVRWDRVEIGTSAAVVQVWVNGRTRPVELALVIHREILSYRWTTRSVDLGDIDRCSTDPVTAAVALINTGTLPLDRVAIEIDGVVVRESGERTRGLPPGDTLELALEIASLPPGPFSSTVVVGDSLCGGSDTIRVAGRLLRALPELLVDEAVVSGAIGCDFPRPLQVGVLNRGNRTDRIVEVIASAEWITLSSDQLPTELSIGDTARLAVVIDPPTPGAGVDTLWLITEECGDTLQMLIASARHAPEWGLLDSTLTLLDVVPGEAATGEATLVNRSERPVRLASLLPSPEIQGLQVVSPPPGTEVGPGEAVVIRVSYASDDPVRQTTTLFLSGPDCLPVLRLPVRIEPGTIDLYLSLSGASGPVDGILPVALLAEASHRFPDSLDLELQLSWSARGFVLSDLSGRLSRTDSLSVPFPVTSGGVGVSYRGIPEFTGETLGTIDVRLLLADSLDWNLHLDGLARMVDTTGVRVRLHLRETTVSIADLCDLDGPRLIRLRPGIYLGGASPNPTSSDLHLTLYSSYRDAHEARLALINIAGVTVWESIELIVPGRTGLTLDLSPFPSGHYRLVLETGGMSNSLQLVRP